MYLPSNGLLASDKEFLKPLIEAAVQETLEAGMTETLGADRAGREDRPAGAAGSRRTVLNQVVRALPVPRRCGISSPSSKASISEPGFIFCAMH
jgi:hypothetical protein